MIPNLPRIIMESPYGGTLWQRFMNRQYAYECLYQHRLRHEAAIASHLLWPKVLPDNGIEREWGIAAGHSWISSSDLLVFWVDRGISPGMWAAYEFAKSLRIPWECRSLHSEKLATEVFHNILNS